MNHLQIASSAHEAVQQLLYIAVAGSFSDSALYVLPIFLGDARVLCLGVEHNKEPDEAPNQSHNSHDEENGLPSYSRD